MLGVTLESVSPPHTRVYGVKEGLCTLNLDDFDNRINPLFSFSASGWERADAGGLRAGRDCGNERASDGFAFDV